MKIEVYTNKYGKELRVKIGETIYFLNTSGMVGEETSNEDLWMMGFRIGFTRISKFFKPFGIYLFKATYHNHELF